MEQKVENGEYSVGFEDYEIPSKGLVVVNTDWKTAELHFKRKAAAPSVRLNAAMTVAEAKATLNKYMHSYNSISATQHEEIGSAASYLVNLTRSNLTVSEGIALADALLNNKDLVSSQWGKDRPQVDATAEAMEWAGNHLIGLPRSKLTEPEKIAVADYLERNHNFIITLGKSLNREEEARNVIGWARVVTNRAMKSKRTSTFAVVHRLKAVKRNGGIDFNAANLNLQVKRDGRGMLLPLNRQDMAQLSQIQGLVPEIIEIQPALGSPVISRLQQKLQSSAV